MKILLFCLLTLTSAITGFGQYSAEQLDKIIATYSEDKLVLESSRLLEEGYFVPAEKIVDKLLSTAPDNCNYNYRKGFLLSEGRGKFIEAIPYLEKASKDIDKNYDMYSGNEKSAAVDVLYHLAKCYHRAGNLDKAETNYRAFLAQATNKKTDLTKASDLGLEQLSNAKKSLEFPKKNVNVVNLGDVINSANPEYSPVVSFDGSALYFTSRREWPEGQSADFKDQRYDLFPEDIYVSYRDFDDSWIAPSRLEFCTADQNEASISVSADERRIYVYEDIVGNGDIFYSDFSTNRFKKIQPCDREGVNTEFWETHCSVTPDGRTMYFTSERPEGYGGRDIYRIVKLPDGSWSKPFNLGPTINSEFDEDAPFMASDNHTLYFASNGPKSIGGFDIMLSVVDEDNNWSMPINLGYPMNSTSDDLFYTETLDGRRGYITSMRADGKGEKDIYEIQNDYLNINRGAILKGKVITLNNRPMPEDVTITLACTDCGEQAARTVYPRVRDGAFMMNLEPCHTYDVIFHHNNGETEFYREELKTDCIKEKDEIYREVYLDADKMAIVEKPVTDSVDTTHNVVIPVVDPNSKVYPPLAFKHNFGYNKNKLTVSGGGLRSFLNDVEKQLKNGRPDVVIEIYSSASFVPTVVFKNNQELSETRAQNVKRDLEAHFAQSKYKGKVTVKIVSEVVSGPAYEEDPKNEKKYEPFQFVELKTR